MALVIPGNALMTMLCVQLAEDDCVGKWVSQPFQRWRMVLASLQGFLEILGIQADPQRAVGHFDVCDAGHSLGRLTTGCRPAAFAVLANFGRVACLRASTADIVMCWTVVTVVRFAIAERNGALPLNGSDVVCCDTAWSC